MGLLTLALALAGGAVAAPIAITGIIALVGFGAAGVAVGTPAAALMASYGGAVGAGSACAVLQSIGAAGLGTAGTAAAGTIGGAISGAIALLI
ncbi:hypothetical protein BGZ65_004318 [Modicella reniformis]|uniref:Interferon alpha-inducible protein 27-like protein 2A n=1 Tax=Modicella reniformis TaxID=1440133 RepID=A0A9P6MHH9_9FUNG|nr:hypothetical protein BGZ65_004318 [Modicella reniformis]